MKSGSVKLAGQRLVKRLGLRSRGSPRVTIDQAR